MKASGLPRPCGEYMHMCDQYSPWMKLRESFPWKIMLHFLTLYPSSRGKVGCIFDGTALSPSSPAPFLQPLVLGVVQLCSHQPPLLPLPLTFYPQSLSPLTLCSPRVASSISIIQWRLTREDNSRSYHIAKDSKKVKVELCCHITLQ